METPALVGGVNQLLQSAHNIYLHVIALLRSPCLCLCYDTFKVLVLAITPHSR